MVETSGLGKLDRERLAAVLRGMKGSISVAEAADALKMSTGRAAKLMARWAQKGWLMRLKRGFYVPVPLESRAPTIPIEDPWIVAPKLFEPCYIGGWTAAGFWELTDQIFRTTVVFTVKKPQKRNVNVQDAMFLLVTVPEKALFGLKPIWRSNVKVEVSDPSRTILDLLNEPRLGGGLRSSVDIFRQYLTSEKKDLKLLIDYAKLLGNGAVFKRLGFLLEKFSPDEHAAMASCREALTKGNAFLDPGSKKERLVTRWRLWVPKGWMGAR